MKRNFEIKKSIRENILGDSEKMYSITLTTKDPVIYHSAENVLTDVTVGPVPAKRAANRERMVSLILDYDECFDNSVANIENIIRFVDYLQKNGIGESVLSKYRGSFQAYCGRHSSCDKCDKRIRRLCEKKNRITEKQENIIKRENLR